MNKPDFFIVGAPKCGTTAFDRYLGEHPEIFMCPRKECHYFGEDLDVRYDHVSWAEYLSYFCGAGDARRIGESSVYYLFSQRAAEEIAAFCPDAGIIIMLRNPVDMMFALHSQLRYNAVEDRQSFPEALAAEEGRWTDATTIDKKARTTAGFYYRRVGRYAQQVRRYFDAFGRDKVLVILFDDFKADTPGVYRRALKFLGVDPTFEPSFTPVNTNKTVRWRWLQRLAWSGPFARSYRLRQLVPGPVRAAIRRLNSKVHQRAAMDPALRAQLTEEFAPVVAELGDLLGRDLSHWSRLDDTACPSEPADATA